MRSSSLAWGVRMMPLGSCCIQACFAARMFSASASATAGHCARLSWAIMAMAVCSVVPSPGPMASAWKSSVGTGSEKIVSSRSRWSTASGASDCRMAALRFGVCTVTLPAPARMQALVARTAAPAMP